MGIFGWPLFCLPHIYTQIYTHIHIYTCVYTDAHIYTHISKDKESKDTCHNIKWLNYGVLFFFFTPLLSRFSIINAIGKKSNKCYFFIQASKLYFVTNLLDIFKTNIIHWSL